MALRRVDISKQDDDLLAHLNHPHIHLLPNTSGVRTAKEAVFAAELAREALGTNWVKLEIHPDPRYLLPDSEETLKATEQLVKLGFVVLPYIQADPVLCVITSYSIHYTKLYELFANSSLQGILVRQPVCSRVALSLFFPTSLPDSPPLDSP